MSGCTSNKNLVQTNPNKYNYGWINPNRLCIADESSCSGWLFWESCVVNCDAWENYPYCVKYPPTSKFGVIATPELQNLNQQMVNACKTTQKSIDSYATQVPPNIVKNAQEAVQVGIKPLPMFRVEKSSNPFADLFPLKTTAAELQNNVNMCNSYSNTIRSYAIDDCSNPNTLIDSNNKCYYEGMTTTREGFTANSNTTLNDAYQQISAQNLAAYNISQNALNAINPNLDAPQLNNVAPNSNPIEVNAILNNYALQTDSFLENQTYTLSEVRSILETQNAYSSIIYNNCTNPKSLLDISGVQQCLPNYYNTAKSTCDYASNLATSANDTTGGMKTIPLLWANAENSLHGNSSINSKSILSDVTNKCKNWVSMYDQWIQDEQNAEDVPCVPERPIQPSFNPTIQNIVENWVNASEKYIEALMKRLQVIEKYIENYPNILTLNSNNIQTLPPGQPPYLTIRRVLNPTTPGVSPTFSLHMDLPQGNRGVKGSVGKTGPKGPKGSIGSSGPSGKTGKWEIPVQYQNSP